MCGRYPAAGRFLLYGWVRLAIVLACAAASGQTPEPAHSIDDEYNRAWAMLDRHQFAEARAAALRLIEKAPEYHRTYRVLAWASVELGVPFESDPIFERAPVALREYALVERAIATGEVENIRRHAQGCIDADPHFAPCYFRLFMGVVGRPLGRFIVPTSAPAALAEVIRATELAGKQQHREAAALLFRYLRSMGGTGPEIEAAVLEVAGSLFTRTSAWEDAVEAFSRLFRLREPMPVWEDWFSAANILAWALDSGGRSEEAHQIVDRAISAARRHDLPFTTSGLLYRRGLAHSTSGNHEEAIATLKEAQETLSRLGGNDLSVLLDLARAYQRKGDFDAAEVSFEQMAVRARTSGQVGQVAFALRGLSQVAEKRGDYFRALRLGSESVRIFREEGLQWQAGAGVGNLCRFAASLGDYQSAKTHCSEALASARRFQDTGEIQRILADQGEVALQFGQFREALVSLDGSLQLAETAKNKTFEVSALVTLAEVYRRIGRNQGALAYAEQALKVARQTGEVGSVGRALIEAGTSRLATGDARGAAAAFEEASSLAARIGSNPIGRDAHLGLGRVAMSRGDLAEAARWLEAAVTATESMRARLQAPEHKAGFARENADLYEDLIQVLAARERTEPGRGYGLRALNVAERGRARAFLDMVAEWRADLSGQLDAGDRKRRDELLAALSKRFREDQEHPCERHRAGIAESEQRLADWLVELRARNPAYANVAFPEPLDGSGVERLARDHGLTILEFALGEPASHLWVVSRDGARLLTLPGRSTIERAVRRLRTHLTRAPRSAGSVADYQKVSARLYRLLFAGLKSGEISGKLLIVPDGLLYYVPFEALVARRTATGDAVYLNDEALISYAPSVSVVAELRQRAGAAARKAQMELLAFGAPATAGGTHGDLAAVVRSAYTRAGLRLSPLPNARLELRAVSRLFPPESRKMVSGRAATEEAFKSEPLERYRRVHVASHAVLDEKHPERSGIVFTLRQRNRDEDGILRVNEVLQLKMAADLVVISACETGLGKLVRGEGLVGLTRALMYAGAERVGVSLWMVNDASTAELMKAFYQGLRAGKPAAEALRAARRKVAREMGQAYRHPYFWAPFVIVGQN